MGDDFYQIPSKEKLLAEYGLAPPDAYGNEDSITAPSKEDPTMQPAHLKQDPLQETQSQQAWREAQSPRRDTPAGRAAIAHGQSKTTEPAAALGRAPAPEPMQLNERGMIVPKDTNELHRLAKNMMDSSLMHPSVRTVPQAMMCIQMAYSLNLNPFTACRQISIRNNSMCVHGDLELAMVRMSGKLQEIREFLFVETKDGKYQERSFENANADVEVLGAVCRVKRDDTWHEEMFTVTNAKRSKLWGKPGPWTLFSSRMLQMRARGLAMRNVFSDVTQGLDTVEYGHEGVER